MSKHENVFNFSLTSKNLLASAMATTIAEIISLPVGTVKTNFQNTTEKSIRDSIKKIYQQSGIRGFYVASTAAVASQVISMSSKYTFYRYLEDLNLPYSNKIINGMLSGIASSVITHPFDAIKIHLQMNTPFMPEIRRHGISVIYRGYSKTFCKVCVGSSLFFPIYDYANSVFKNNFYAAITSSVISTFIIHPIDYLKTRHIYGLPRYQGWNPLIYYKGLTLNLARIVPNFVIIMTMIDYLKTKF